MNQRIYLNEILDIVSTYYNVSESDIKSKSRLRRYVIPREKYAYLAIQYTGLTFEKISSFINRNHATIIYFNTKVKDELINYDDTKEDISKLSILIDEYISNNVFSESSFVIPRHIDLLKLLKK